MGWMRRLGVEHYAVFPLRTGQERLGMLGLVRETGWALELVPPRDYPHWEAATGLEPLKTGKRGFGTYAAADYDEKGMLSANNRFDLLTFSPNTPVAGLGGPRARVSS